MAIVTLIAPVAAVSGKVTPPGGQANTGAVVMMPDPNGRTLMRQFVSPDQPQTASQLFMQAIFTSISEAMQTLTQPEVEAWQALAQEIVRSGRLGPTYRLSWTMLFQQVNSYRMQDGLAITTTAPSMTIAAGPTGVTSITSDDGDPTQDLNILVTEAGAPPATTKLAFRATRSMGSPNRQARDNELRYFADSVDCIMTRDTSAPYNYHFTATKLNILVGQFVGIEIKTLNASYVPVARVFLSNIEVTAP